MSNLSRLLLIGLLAIFWVWGFFFASVEQQNGLSRSAQSAVHQLPSQVVSGAQQVGYVLRRLIE